ncbi:MAG TPA: OadG family protein [Candidatus Blautia excrementipullorum]|nr:OadG family protein [Candidatus Blautia excrementipullorum]
MNQRLKKASSVCAALACAVSLTVSGTSFVMAAGEIDDAVKDQIVMTAEGLTDTIITLSEDEIESYLESGDEFTENAMNAWNDVREDLGEHKETGETEVEASGDEYTATVPVEFEKEDAEFVYEFDETMMPVSVSVNIQYSLATSLKNAALNTVMGLGTVFVVLAVLIFLISLFKYIPGSPAAKKKEESKAAPAPAAAAPAPAPAPAAVPAADDKELIAVIAAAIAAAEGTSPDGFVVRSIRKINRKRR